MTSDEIVITLTEAEFDQLRLFLNDTFIDTRAKRKRDRVRDITNMVCRNANHLSLKWLDQKLEEFA